MTLVGAAGPALRILAVSGSLRAGSSNTAILHAAALAARAGVQVVVYDGIGTLPFFNPDLDRGTDDPALPDAVRHLRGELQGTDALLISTPEYAHGIPGVLKNALDWLVGGPEMVGRAVLPLRVSSHSVHAYAQLVETLHTMSARVVEAPPIDLPRGGPALDPRVLVADPRIGIPLSSALDLLGRASLRAHAQ